MPVTEKQMEAMMHRLAEKGLIERTQDEYGNWRFLIPSKHFPRSDASPAEKQAAEDRIAAILQQFED